MMITIHGLPLGTKYQEVKVLIKQECNISDFILDYLVNDTDGSKKVRVGLADDSEGSHLIKCLDGFRMSGNVLRLVPFGKSAAANAQQPNTYEVRGNYQRPNYPNQYNDRNVQPVESFRPAPWANNSNQWSPNQPQATVQNSYGLQQQPIAPTFIQQLANPVVKPHFDPREGIPGRAPQNPTFGYAPKSNLISLGPERNVQSNLRELPEATNRSTQPGRYPSQNYHMPSEKPMTIMKDNFQGPPQYNINSIQNVSSNFPSHNQTSWDSQHQQQKYEKSVPTYDKKPYDDRKYPGQIKPEISKSDDHYRYEKSSRDFSPQRRSVRESDERRVSPGRRYSPSRKQMSYSDRQISPNRRGPSSSGRHISPDKRGPSSSGRHISPDKRGPSSSGRHISPDKRGPSSSGRHISPDKRGPSSSGRHISPDRRGPSSSGRHISPDRRGPSSSGRHISPARRGPSSTGRHISPDKRVPSSSGKHISPERRISPSGRHVSSSGRRDSPPRRQISPPGRHVSSTGRHASPSASQVSPSSRHVALSSRHGPPPTRHISPSGRRISPTDRHISSTGTSKHMSDRRFSPLGRQIPMERKISPTRKLSPQMRKEDYIRGRRISPPAHSPMDRRPSRQSPGRVAGMASHRQESPRRQSRYSPSRHLGKPMNFQDERNIKDVRPAYEPQSQASNQAMYSDGYRLNVRDETKYIQSRQEQWQDRDNFSSKSVIEDRREVQRMKKYDGPRIMDQSKEHELRRSRSPKRDRSPLRDRYKRHSPSPRSPRRSWALEKRRSPVAREPPPPPNWPQEREEYKQKTRLKFTDPVMEKNSPVWETREKKRDDFQITDERRNFEEPRRKEVQKWKPIPTSNPPQTSSRFDDSKSSRPDLEDRRDFSHVNDIHILRSARRERDDLSYKPEFETKVDMPRKKDEYSGRIEEKKKSILEKQEQLQKEIEEVYKRAVDFTKKAEMYKKSEHKTEPCYDEDRRRNEGHDDSKDFHRKRESYEKDRREDDLHKDYSNFTRKEDVHKSVEFTRSRHEPEEKQKLRFVVSSAIKAKRNKAIEEISEKMMCKYGDYLPEEIKDRVMNELQWTLRRKLFDMFEDNDISFIEMVVKFNARHAEKDEEKIFTDVIASLPSHYKNLKRTAQDESDIPTKSSRRSREPSLKKDIKSRESTETNWDISTFPQSMPIVPAMSIMTGPVMVPMPPRYQIVPTYQQMPQVVEETKKDGYTLYLCKHDFQPIYEYETDLLKNFLIQQLIKVTETSQGWAPDFTLNKQHSTYRHEVVTRDELSKDWLLNLDFSEFTEFNVLVYTTEELWYERAAIWLPGHSRSRNIEPIVKLKLQNKHLEDVNIGKWKIVKKIVTLKGTRLYVDMPPVSARALEKYKMTLSFELQKVNVFLKAVAIDKNAFDAGLNEPSIQVLPSPGSDPMPSITDHPDLVKMAFKGNKPLPLPRARQLKDIILYKMYKYLELNGKSRTDFLKYGLCQGGFFGILPENEESKRWLCGLDLGKIQRVPIIILGSDGSKSKYFKMTINMPKDYQLNTTLAMERIRQSNRGVKGLNFSLWKNLNLVVSKKRVMIELDMDIDSVETISKMNYQLDYVLNGINSDSLKVESGYSHARLEEIIAKHKAELSDSYDVANMDIATDSDDEVICLD